MLDNKYRVMAYPLLKARRWTALAVELTARTEAGKLHRLHPRSRLPLTPGGLPSDRLA
jgi:hypothetical protein